MIQCNIYTKFIERLTNTLRIWTFQCNFPYIRHFYVELPNNIAIKLRMNSDQSEIWFSAIFTPNLLNFWQIHFEFEHFNATVPISVISMKNYKISLQLNLKLSWSISNLNSMEYMDQNYWAFNKYASNMDISMQLYLYKSFLWRTTKYHCN